MTLLDYFLKYVKVDTQSSEDSTSSPSTKKQLDLSRELLADLKALGVDSYMDEFGVVYGFIPGEGNEVIGFNAHIDTALEVSGKDVKPRIIEHYDGKDIKLNNEYVTKVEDFPFLTKFINKTLVVTDGTTLLGADDKAGLAIIMSLANYLSHHKEVKHQPISIMFTCDEEVGRGPEHFDKNKFKADYAYSLDGSSPYEISYENFNAKAAMIKIKGVSIHPGDAKGKMISAIKLLLEFDSLLPKNHSPYDTERYEGFHHLMHIDGDVEEASAYYILREHDMNKMNVMVNQFKEAISFIQNKYKKAVVNFNIHDSYKNMKEVFDKDNRALLKIEKTYKKLNIPFIYEPIRGGTDGATFSFKGCPTPNLGTGSYNHHGRHEFFVKEEGELLVEILKELVKI